MALLWPVVAFLNMHTVCVRGALPIQRVNVDVTSGMLEELDRAALNLNVSRQGVIKTLVRQALDQHYLARKARAAQ